MVGGTFAAVGLLDLALVLSHGSVLSFVRDRGAEGQYILQNRLNKAEARKEGVQSATYSSALKP